MTQLVEFDAGCSRSDLPDRLGRCPNAATHWAFSGKFSIGLLCDSCYRRLSRYPGGWDMSKRSIDDYLKEKYSDPTARFVGFR